MVDGVPTEVADADAWVEIEARTGRDDDPNIYHEYTDSGKEFPVTRARFENELRLPETEGILKLDQQPGMYSSYAATYSERFALMGLTPDQLGFDGPPDRVWPEIALRFTLSQLMVHTAIIGTTNSSHVRSNLAAARKGILRPEVLDQLEQAFQEAESRVDQSWLGQT